MKTITKKICFSLICSFFVAITPLSAVLFCGQQKVTEQNFSSSREVSSNINLAKAGAMKYQTLAELTTPPTEPTTPPAEQITPEEKLRIIREIQLQSQKLLEDGEQYKVFENLLYTQLFDLKQYIEYKDGGLNPFLTTNRTPVKYGAQMYLTESTAVETKGQLIFEELRPDKIALEALLKTIELYPTRMEEKRIDMINVINANYKRIVLGNLYDIKTIAEKDRPALVSELAVLSQFDSPVDDSYVKSMAAKPDSAVELDQLEGFDKYSQAKNIVKECLNKLDAIVLFNAKINVYKANGVLAKPVLQITVSDKTELTNLKTELEKFNNDTYKYISEKDALQVKNLLWLTNIRLDIIKQNEPSNVSNMNWSLVFGLIIGMMLIVMTAFLIKMVVDRKKVKVPYYQNQAKDDNINAKQKRGEMPKRLYLINPTIVEKSETELLHEYEKSVTVKNKKKGN